MIITTQVSVKTITNAADMVRYWTLNELRHNRARLRVGSISEPNARKERKSLQRALVKLRASRPTE